jgi:KTSC domain
MDEAADVFFAGQGKALGVREADANEERWQKRAYRRCVAAQSLIALSGVMLSLLGSARSETVDVKYGGRVDLRVFVCTETKSSFVNRVCYDKMNAYMLILLNSIWYHYCEIDPGTVASLINADSVGRFYNTNIKGTGSDGPFDCRTHRAPKYSDG